MIESLKDIVDLSQYVGTEPFCALRVNPIKTTLDEFLGLCSFQTEPCKFYKYARLIKNEDKCGTDPLHFAGAYYIQEPSAMSAITALDIQSTDVVLDVCAAPGSKATAIAAVSKLLVANEINPSRAKALIGNIERMGISNALVLNTSADKLSSAFEGYFDKVLVDSPCSGEGMFRKHPEILNDWTPELVSLCAKRSKEILQNAAQCLKEGGRLVYSTCTYNIEENEKVIINFLKNNPDFEITDTGLSFGSEGLLGLAKARRITINDGGEGHFVCAITRKSCKNKAYVKPFKLKNDFSFLEGIIKSPCFLKGQDFGVMEFEGVYYALPCTMPNPKGVRILRAGVKLGEKVGKIFRPDHHLFMALDKNSFCNIFETDSPEHFLKGAELGCEPSLHGYCAVTYKGFVLGFGKASDGRLKNHFPKGLRIL